MEHIKVAQVEHVRLLPCSYPAPSTSSGQAAREREGTLHLTPHHLVFRYAGSKEELWLLHSLLQSVTVHPPSTTSFSPLVVRTFTFDTYTFLFRDFARAQDVCDSIKSLVSSATLASSYAYAYKKTEDVKAAKLARDGWDVYDPQRELARMGVGGSKPRSDAWRWADVNADYEFCSTYPAKLAVPARISDVTLRYGKTYRSKARVPALVYLHWANLGSITRSSQPMVGIKNARSIQDEKLIEAIFHSHALHSTSAPKPHQAVYGAKATNLIIDARPTTNAMANVAKGAGTENMEYYKDCKKAYLGVDNIHVMRDSLKQLTEALRDAEITGYVDRDALRKSGWLKHIAALLDGAVLIARNVHLANSHVLVHCSDGWDRTSQLSSLAQLCLDPYYRTIEGYAVLIEKDWLSFGHKFADRTGHFVRDRTQFVVAPGDAPQSAQAALLANVQKSFAFGGGSHGFKETSPVFHQFLDCTWQMMRQHPARFEFDERFLLQLHLHLFTCQYGTFLYNSEKERATGGAQAREATKSVWELFLGDRKVDFLNPLYDASLDNPASRARDADLGVLFPDPKRVAFWPSLYRRTEEELNGHYAVAGEEEEVAPPEPEFVGPIDGTTDDPGLDPVTTLRSPIARSSTMQFNGSPSSTPSSLPSSPSDSQILRGSGLPSSFTSASSSVAAVAGPQIQNAYQGFLKFGGSTLKTLRKGYEDAVKELSTPSPTSTEVEGEMPPRRTPSPMLPAAATTNPWASTTGVETAETLPRTSQSQPAESLPRSSLTAAPTQSVLDGRRNPWAATTVSADEREPAPLSASSSTASIRSGAKVSRPASPVKVRPPTTTTMNGDVDVSGKLAELQVQSDPLGVGL